MAKVKQAGNTQDLFYIDPGSIIWTTLDNSSILEGGSIVPPKEQEAKPELSKPVKDKTFTSLPRSFTAGLDVEFIMKDKKTHSPVSAQDRIPGTKKDPFRVSHGTLQADGVLLEIGIKPAMTYFDWERNISSVISSAKEWASKYNCYLSKDIEAEFPEAELNSPLAWESGCDPDWNCWTGEEYQKLDYSSRLRTCGGHIHVGKQWSYGGIFSKRAHPDDYKVDPHYKESLAKTLDFYLGTMVAYLEPKNKRRSLYGREGAFRFKSYGVELRTPSNYWIHSALHRKYVWYLINFSLNKRLMGDDPQYRTITQSVYNGEIGLSKLSKYGLVSYPDFLKYMKEPTPKIPDYINVSAVKPGVYWTKKLENFLNFCAEQYHDEMGQPSYVKIYYDEVEDEGITEDSTHEQE